jgi:hypothetical protein
MIRNSQEMDTVIATFIDDIRCLRDRAVPPPN